MSSITRRAQIKKSLVNPDENTIVGCYHNQIEIALAYDLQPEFAREFRIEPQGVIHVIVDKLTPGVKTQTGGYLFVGRFFQIPKEKPLVVKGFFDAINSTGHFDLTKN